nr:reverse transcriptase domain-containing protein [Tanacetum cinerariifolium]
NSSASTSTDRSIPAASRNRPAYIHAGRHIPAGRFNKLAPFPAGRSVPTGWTNHAARPFFRPTNLYFDNVSWPGIYDHMSTNEERWGSVVKSSAGTKWILKNKRDVRGIVVRNKARLVAQGHRQEEGIDYDEISLSGSPHWDAQSLGNGDLPVPDLWTMEELCQPSLNGRGGPILEFRNSIKTFEQMAKMFLGKYFPPSMVTKLRNEITNFHQHPDESLCEAWERYKLSIDRCPNHNMFLVIQQVKVVTPNCETCGDPHSFNDCPTTVGNTQNVYAAGAYQGNTISNPKEELKGITTRSGTEYQGPTIPTTSSISLVVERETEATKDMVHPINNGSAEDV